MKRLALILILGFVFACGGKKEGDGGGGADENVTWPAAPTDGQPVTLQFVSVGPDKRGKDLEAQMRVFNFSDKEVKRISMTLDYLDGTGKKLKDFPWGMMGVPNVVGPKGTKVDGMGAFIPAETKKVEARVRSVEFGDGTKWESKKDN
jgi:hypothetical protein